MINTTAPTGLDADQQDSAQVAALACSQVHPDSALPSIPYAPTPVQPGPDLNLLARFGGKRIRADGELKVCFNADDLAALLAYTRRYGPSVDVAKLAREALEAVQRSYGVSLTSYPPQSAWMVNRVDDKVRDALAALAMHAKKVSWTPASNPPDADTTVMLALSDGEVWQGYFDGADWIEVSGLRLAPGRVKYWQHTPAHPEDKS